MRNYSFFKSIYKIMTNEERETAIKEALSGQDLFVLMSVQQINQKPHPFCIGPEHIQRFALDTTKGCAMYVNESGAWTNGYKKGFHKCGLPMDAHTKGDTVCFLSQLRNGTSDEAGIILKDLVNKIGESFIDGFAFVETKEKFRIT